MGLDMYLEKYPKYKGATPRDVEITHSFINYLYNKVEKEFKYSFKEWCGYDITQVNLDFVEFYSNYYVTRYSDWDTEKKYGWKRITSEIGYWRKANHIHRWFVENVQNGVDDCGVYEVTKNMLERLLAECKKVKEIAILEDGLVKNGSHYEDGKWIDEYASGKVVVNAEAIAAILPTSSGFFFGCTDYDDWYMSIIDNTIDIIEKVLAETDFENEVVFYESSW